MVIVMGAIFGTAKERNDGGVDARCKERCWTRNKTREARDAIVRDRAPVFEHLVLSRDDDAEKKINLRADWVGVAVTDHENQEDYGDLICTERVR